MVISTVKVQSSVTIGTTDAIVKIEPLSGITYSGTPKIWLNALVQQATLSLGKEPSSATILIPVAEADDSLGTTSNEIVHEGTSNTQRRITKFSAPNFAGAENMLFSRVFLYTAVKNISEQSEGAPFLVGYITSYDWVAAGEGSTAMLVTIQDGRYFMRKAPAQGVVFLNNRANETVYIRANSPIFNEGRRPNRAHFANDGLTSNQQPTFCDVDLNRFNDNPGDSEDRQYVGDDQVVTLSDSKQVPDPHARKWLPGHVWNLYRYMHSPELLDIMDKPTATELGRTPDARDVPVDISPYVNIPMLDEKTSEGAYRDFFNPRAQIGGATQTGTTQFVSGLGEFSANGLPLIDILMEMCRRVGNYTLAARYRDDGLMDLIPFRTTLATAGNDTKFGLRSAGALVDKNAGKSFDLTMKVSGNDSAAKFPDVHSWSIKQSTENYYTGVFHHGGQRFIQLTISTLGTGDWTDHLDIDHTAYSPSGEWVPKTPKGALQPGWTKDDQDEWVAIFDANSDLELFPNVFRSWIVPDDIDWVAVWNQAATAQGFRMFLEKERQHLGDLISAAFEKTKGIFRSRKQRLPVFIWRAYQGIPINAAGDEEKYDGNVGDAVQDQTRWKLRVGDVDILTDGRLGFQLGPDARRGDGQVVFEDGATDATNGKTRSPWSWNGETDIPQAYEMFMTFAVAVDEDLYDTKALKDDPAQLLLRDFGPRQEAHRNSGSEYQQHIINNSVIEARGTKLHQPLFATGGNLLARDDTAEIAARVMLDINRLAKPDIEGDLNLDRIRTEFIPGQAINHLRFGNDTALDVRVDCIISKVIHNFTGKNQTILQIATIR